MTLEQIMDKANQAYPDDLIRAYWDEPHANHGDTLARFIVAELQDVFDSEANDATNLKAARNAITRAAKELTDVAEALTHA
jgi:hypothetical protein